MEIVVVPVDAEGLRRNQVFADDMGADIGEFQNETLRSFELRDWLAVRKAVGIAPVADRLSIEIDRVSSRRQ